MPPGPRNIGDGRTDGQGEGGGGDRGIQSKEKVVFSAAPMLQQSTQPFGNASGVQRAGGGTVSNRCSERNVYTFLVSVDCRVGDASHLGGLTEQGML